MRLELDDTGRAKEQLKTAQEVVEIIERYLKSIA